jgi:hypothetical protein
VWAKMELGCKQSPNKIWAGPIINEKKKHLMPKNIFKFWNMPN